VVFSVVNRVMMSTFQGIFGSVVKSIETDPIGPLVYLMPDDSWGTVVPKRESAKQDLTPFAS